MLEGRRIKGLWLGIGTHALNAQLGRRFNPTVEKRLAHDQGVGGVFHFQPVARFRLAAEDDFEVALGIDFQLAGIDESGLDQGAVGFIAAFLGAETQVGDAAALTFDAIVQLAVQARVLVEVVRVVGTDLRGLVGGFEEAGKGRIGKLDVHFQANAQQAREVAETFGAGGRIGRRFGAQNLLAAAFEVIAKRGPGLATQQMLFVNRADCHCSTLLISRTRIVNVCAQSSEPDSSAHNRATVLFASRRPFGLLEAIVKRRRTGRRD
ncbi:hypothetical protein PS685_05303 [Pseudomonas fluorescens]|uniref:Uncharacterized protein n=1 Tax=Pseudomonas fluorescens TaxID=294 RepID=A0A5E7AN33_PSEFL|nr:hypothetical protein PS685_05303 [Pseudomonas fluorescens]